MRAVRTLVRNAILGLERRLPVGVRVAMRDAEQPMARLDCDDADIRLVMGSAHDYTMRRFSCMKEPNTVRWIREHVRPGDVLYDVGANVGAYALYAAVVGERRTRVWAFEPAFANHATLCRNVLLNGCGGTVTPVAGALGDRTGPAVLALGDVRSGAADHAVDALGTESGLGILSYRLDDWVAHGFGPRPNHVKIDVDGHEVAVLDGGPMTLADPELRSVLIEVEPRLLGAVQDRLDRAGLSLAAEYPRASVINQLYVRRNEGTVGGSHPNRRECEHDA